MKIKLFSMITITYENSKRLNTIFFLNKKLGGEQWYDKNLRIKLTV